MNRHKKLQTLSKVFILTLSWRRPLSYRNQSIDLLCKSMAWFLYDNGPRHERVKKHSEIGILKIIGIFSCIYLGWPLQITVKQNRKFDNPSFQKKCAFLLKILRYELFMNYYSGTYSKRRFIFRHRFGKPSY